MARIPASARLAMNLIGPSANIGEKEEIEIDYWRTSELESPESDSIDNIVNKMAEAKDFLSRLDRYANLFAGSSRILEIGAGQGWAAHIVKRRYPGAYVIATDISPHAVRSSRKWERVLEARVDDIRVCRSYELPFEDSSIDPSTAFSRPTTSSGTGGRCAKFTGFSRRAAGHCISMSRCAEPISIPWHTGASTGRDRRCPRMC